MNKRQELMENAIRLFSEKGFHQASIQEIAQEAGISKGAFYKHFDSKENILIEILQQYQMTIIQEVTLPNIAEASGNKEVIVRKLNKELVQWITNREFFLVLFREFPPNENQQITEIMEQLKAAMTKSHREALLSVYGDEVQPYITDLTVMLEGMLKEYILLLIFQRADVDTYKLAELLVGSMDAIIHSLGRMKPIFGDRQIENVPQHSKEELIDRLTALAEKVDNLPRQQTSKEKILEALQLIREELMKDHPRSLVPEAMIAYLKQEKVLETDLLLLENTINKYLEEV